jgi:hypothetical protein
MTIFLFDTCDGNVNVPPVALPPEPEIAVARATSRRRSFLAHPAHLPSESSYSRRNGQIREIQVVHVQRGA